MPRLLLAICFWIAPSSLPAAVLAQAASPEPAQVSGAELVFSSEKSQTDYQAAIDQAVDEFALSDFAEARSLFGKAHAILPNARTWRGIGMTEFELRNYPASIDALGRALQDPVRPLDLALRDETESLLARARAFVSRVQLTLRPNVKNATLLIDDLPGQRDQSGSLLVSVGDHVLEVRVPGYLTEKRKLSVAGGDQEQLDILLSPQHESAQSAERKSPIYKNPWLWASVGALVIGGVVLGAVLATRKDPAEHTLTGSPEIGGGLVQTLRFPR